ncbi:BTAD domain-containing putative transcriptional regulator [Streptomyces sp. NPDC089799]|uniref:AfsR/SARP family transcriptional regulator n=1 Tax=Streptomyces sp. NPDC089799 TaxID=3155066 RepID=UPI003433010A
MPYDTSLPAPALRLLGTFRLETRDPDGRTRPVPVEAPGQRVLAFLGLHPPAGRSVLAGTLWPEVAETNAQGSLRTALWRLRRGGPSPIDSRGETLALREDLTVDVHNFVRTALRVVNSEGDPGEEPGLGLLFAGDLLPGWDEEWVVFERERLRQLRLHALESLSARLSRRGRHALALDAALTCVSIEPLRESAHRAVVAVHLAEHNTVEAVRQYGAFRRLVRAELGLEPSPRFTAMLPAGPADLC